MNSSVVTACLALVNAYLVTALSPAKKCSSYEPISDAGTWLIVVFLDLGTWPHCGRLQYSGMQRMEAAQWAVRQLNNVDYGKGITFGFRGYDVCSDERLIIAQAVRALHSLQQTLSPECRTFTIAGIITTGDVGKTEALSNLLLPFKISSLEVNRNFARTSTLEAIASLLVRLRWYSVSLVATDSITIKEFLKMADSFAICVVHITLLDRNRVTEDLSDVIQELADASSSIVVAVGGEFILTSLLSSTHKLGINHLQWVLTTLGIVNPGSGITGLKPGVILLQPEAGPDPRFAEHFVSQYEAISVQQERFSRDGFQQDPMVEQIFGAVLEVAQAAKEARMPSGSEPVLEEKLPWSVHSGNMVVRILNFIKTNQEGRLIEVGRITSTRFVLQQSQMRFYDESEEELGSIPIFRCARDCQCINRPSPRRPEWTESDVVEFTPATTELESENEWPLRWNLTLWSTMCLTLGGVGIFTSIGVIIFITVKLCQGDIIEGSQAFSLLLLFAIIALHLSVIPYALEATPIICVLRVVGPGLAYTLTYSLMLARCVMLATADSGGGYSGHVSGFVQSVLFCFMLAVQIGMTAQLWVFRADSFFLVPDDAESVNYFTKSSPITSSFSMPLNLTLPNTVSFSNGGTPICVCDPLQFLLSLAYSAFLLFALCIMSLFTIRSRRNYKEGLFFCVASIFSSLCWSGWVTVYFRNWLLTDVAEWRDAAVCVGVTASSILLLVIVFIPRVYLIVTSIARDAMTVSLRPLRDMAAPNLTGVHQRGSNMALYDSVEGGGPNPYTPDPLRISSKKDDFRESLYERCSDSIAIGEEALMSNL